jgi:AcrR family transcriptional regulator
MMMGPGPISSPKERREHMRREMVAAILEAARAVMRERGVAGLSLREVARRVQLQASSLYEYFPNKASLYDSLFRMSILRYRELKEHVEGRQFDSTWEYVASWLTTYMQFAYENPDLYQLTFERPVPGFTPSAESMADSEHLLTDFEQTLQRAVDAGWMTPTTSVAHARDLLIAMMHGLTSQHMANEPDLPVGSGRFGSLIPDAVALFRAAWEPSLVTTTDRSESIHQTDRRELQ